MGHNHDHHHHHHSGTENIRVAFFLNLIFTIIEIVGGFLTNSVAILSDALHDLGDSLSLGLAWYFQKVSKKSRDKKFTYGYKRFSLLGALINAIILVVGSVFILMETIPRLANPEMPDAGGMIGLALLGIVVNGAAVIRLRRGDSINENVISLHLLEDVLGWVAVLIGAIVMYFFDFPIIDPVLSILIAGFILLNVYRSLKSSLNIFLQGTPANVDENAIQDYLNSIEGIKSHHDFHVWSMDGNFNILTVHLVVEENSSMEFLSQLKKEIRQQLHKMNIEHTTIEFETKEDQCVHSDC